MSAESSKPPVLYWIAAGVALLWNGLGVMSFVSTAAMSAEAIAALPPAEAALYENTPILSTIAFAVAVFGGLAGSIFLLLRKSTAFAFFVASLIGVVIQFSYWLFMTDAVAVYGAKEAYMMPALVTIIAIVLVWFSRMAKGKGWIS